MVKEQKTNTVGKEPPEGTPPKDAGEKLIFGKYKTLEDAEKAHKEGEIKYHEGQTKLAETERLLETERQKAKLIEEKQEEIKKAKTEEEKQRLQQELDQDLERMGKELTEEAGKGPAPMIRAFYRMFDAYVSTQGFVRQDDLKRQNDADRRRTGIFNKVRAAHKEDFDELAPKMAEIWAKLPPQAKVPEAIETVYLAAKADNLPDEAKLKEKIIADIKAGHGEGGGEKLPSEEKKSEDEKYTDDVIKEHKKTKVTLSE